MNFNKKAFSSLGLGIVIAFIFISMMYVFITAFTYQVGEEFIITPSVEIFNSTAQSLNLDSASMSTINSIDENYKELEIPYDIGFIILLIIAVSISVHSSINAKTQGYGSFWGMLTIGLIFFLFVFGFVELISDWFYNNMIFGFLEFDISTKAPFIYAFIKNSEFYSFLWAISLILINKMNFNILKPSNGEEGGFQE